MAHAPSTGANLDTLSARVHAPKWASVDEFVRFEADRVFANSPGFIGFFELRRTGAEA